MSGRGAKRKGNSGELELIRLLRAEIGPDAVSDRLLDQPRDGGHDITVLNTWAIECRRREQLKVASWWSETLSKAAKANMRPVLAYRQNRRPWQFVMRLSDMGLTGCQHTATLKIEAFADVVQR